LHLNFLSHLTLQLLAKLDQRLSVFARGSGLRTGQLALPRTYIVIYNTSRLQDCTAMGQLHAVTFASPEQADVVTIERTIFAIVERAHKWTQRSRNGIKYSRLALPVISHEYRQAWIERDLQAGKASIVCQAQFVDPQTRIYRC